MDQCEKDWEIESNFPQDLHPNENEHFLNSLELILKSMINAENPPHR